MWLAIPALAAACYYLLAIVAAARWRRPAAWQAGGEWAPGNLWSGHSCPPSRLSSRLDPLESAQRAPTAGRNARSTSPPREWAPPLSVLKPVHGRDPGFYEAIVSHAAQDYPEFELLFGLTDPGDPAIADIERLQREFPGRRIEIVLVETNAPNAKVGVLAELARRARYSLLLVNDSDIVVEPGYFQAVAAPLRDPRIGLVTCLYRAQSESWAAHCEALAIATEFAPSVLVARLLGQAEFALGSTMVFRAGALGRIGGFESIAKYLADDYQLGRHIRQLGYRIEFAPVVVETHLGAESWAQAWQHQLRWSRTIRVSRPAGYYGYVVTHATLWALVAFAGGQWWAGAMALAIRIVAGVLVGAAILKDRGVLRRFWLIPLRDLFGFAVWAGGLFGDRVQWRGRSLQLAPGGIIQASAGAAPGANPGVASGPKR